MADRHHDEHVLCTYEDRSTHLVGVQLLALSLARWWPEACLDVTCMDPPAEFARWAARQRNVRLSSGLEVSNRGWDVKPELLLGHLEAGAKRVTWIDADVIFAGPVPSRLREPEGSLVATEEYYWGAHQGDLHRTLQWGLEPGSRQLPATANTAVLSVSTAHVGLLRTWLRLLGTSEYRAAQGRAPADRPQHLMGDQDVLTALLMSADHASVEVSLLPRGRAIAQCFGPSGFTVREHLRALHSGLPPLVHAMGPKPWATLVADPSFTGRIRKLAYDLHRQVGLYRYVASGYSAELDPPRPGWIEAKTRPGRALLRLTGSNPVLAELPIVAPYCVARWLRRRFGDS